MSTTGENESTVPHVAPVSEPKVDDNIVAEAPAVSQAFKISAETLSRLQESRSYDALHKQFGGVQNIATLVKTDLRNGLSDAEEYNTKFAARKQEYAKQIFNKFLY